MKYITQELVRSLFRYDKGKLYLLTPNHKKKVGDEAGWFNVSNGYSQITINYKTYYRHRIIFLYFYGYLPKFLDHKYGVKIGDYIWNLRPCTHYQNMLNSKLRKNNKSGVKGVCFDRNRWKSQIRFKGKVIHIGYYKNIAEAEQAVIEKREELHGEFANHG